MQHNVFTTFLFRRTIFHNSNKLRINMLFKNLMKQVEEASKKQPSANPTPPQEVNGSSVTRNFPPEDLKVSA